MEHLPETLDLKTVVIACHPVTQAQYLDREPCLHGKARLACQISFD
ncbi:MAG: hypothetical protein ABI171_07405 [Collimonas sp.]